MDSITPTNKSVKTKQDYIFQAENSNRQAINSDLSESMFYIAQAQMFATLALSAPDEAAPADYLAVCQQRDELMETLRVYRRMDARATPTDFSTVCAERDEMKRQRDELMAAAKIASQFIERLQEEPGNLSFFARHPLTILAEAIQNAKQTAEPEAGQ